MSDSFPKGFKIIILQEENLPEHDLKDVIVHCPTIKEFEAILKENSSSILTLACNNDTLIEVAPLLLANRNVDTVYVLTDRIDIMWPIELENGMFETIKITDGNQLMRHLFLKAMLSYFKQGEEYKNKGDYGLANLSFIDAKNAFKQTKLLI